MNSTSTRLYDGDCIDLTSDPETETQESQVSDNEEIVFVDRLFCVDKATSVENSSGSTNIQNKFLVTKEVNSNVLRGLTTNSNSKKIVRCTNVNLPGGVLNLGQQQFVLDETLKKALLKSGSIALVVNPSGGGEQNKTISIHAQEVRAGPTSAQNLRNENSVNTLPTNTSPYLNRNAGVAKIQVLNQPFLQNTNRIEQTVVEEAVVEETVLEETIVEETIVEETVFEETTLLDDVDEDVDEDIIMLPDEPNEPPPLRMLKPVSASTPQAPRFIIHSVTTSVNDETAVATNNLRREMDKTGVPSTPHLPAVANHNITIPVYNFSPQTTQKNITNVSQLKGPPPNGESQPGRVVSNLKMLNINTQVEKGGIKILKPSAGVQSTSQCLTQNQNQTRNSPVKRFKVVGVSPSPTNNQTHQTRISPMKGFQNNISSSLLSKEDVLGKASNKIQNTSNTTAKPGNANGAPAHLDNTKLNTVTARNYFHHLLSTKTQQTIDKNLPATTPKPAPTTPVIEVKDSPPILTPFDANDPITPATERTSFDANNTITSAQERPLPTLIPYEGNENLLKQAGNLTVIKDISGKPVYFLIHPDSNLKHASVESRATRTFDEQPLIEDDLLEKTAEVDLLPPPVVTPVDINKILEQGKKRKLPSRCSCGELKNKKLYRKGFTKIEQKKPPCLKELQKFIKLEDRKIKALRKKMHAYNNSNIVYCGRTLTNLLPENIKSETEDYADFVDLCDQEDDDDDNEFLPTIASVISKVNAELLQLNQNHQKEPITRKRRNDLKVKLSQPNEALQLIQKGLELIQTWTVEKTPQEIPAPRRSRKRKSDPETVKETVVGPKRRRKRKDLEPKEKLTKKTKTKEVKTTGKLVKEKVIRHRLEKPTKELMKERPKIKIKLAGAPQRKRQTKSKMAEQVIENNLTSDDLLLVKRVDILKNNRISNKVRKATQHM